MTIESVRAHLKKHQMEERILELDASSATVQEAAKVLGVEPARIAKSLSFKVGQEAIIVVTAGDAKIDNAKFKTQFLVKAKMLTLEEVLSYTGHPIGGVCPFGLANPLKVYLDVSLRRFATVFPACGTPSSAIEVTCEELEMIVQEAVWIDLCKGWQMVNEEVHAHEHTV